MQINHSLCFYKIITLTISGQGGCAAEGEAAARLQHPHHRGLPPAGEGAQGGARQVRQGGEEVGPMLCELIGFLPHLMNWRMPKESNNFTVNINDNGNVELTTIQAETKVV